MGRKEGSGFRKTNLEPGTFKPKPANGFTLLEVMISLGILSVIFTLLYGTFSAVHRGGEQMEAEADIYRLVRIGTYHMANNLSMIHVASALDGESASLRGEDGDRLIGDDVYANDSLQFVSVSHSRTMPDAPESERARIRYLLDGDTLMQEMILSNGRELRYELGGPIAGLNFRYFDSIKKEWVESWDDAETNKLPLSVEIEFVLKREGREPYRFKTWVDLPKSG